MTTKSLHFSSGRADLDPLTGAPLQFIEASEPGRRHLLDATTPWHSQEHQWGSGFVVTDHGAGRWNSPMQLSQTENSVDATFAKAGPIRVKVHRQGGARLFERYTFTNESDHAITITALGIQTPFADVYEDARNALEHAVHAHVFTGGSWSWVLAQPMSGQGRVLGLIVREGELFSYSIESRNQKTSSNARGHFVLQPTDNARNPQSFGGQPTIDLAAGESYALAWELGWFDTVEQFLDAVDAPASLDRTSALIGTDIIVHTSLPVWSPSDAVLIRQVDGGCAITSHEQGNFELRFGESARTEVAFHTSLEDTIRTRIAYILENQRSSERAGELQWGLVPVDTRTRVTHTANGWSDWSDGSERIGMPILLQLARRLGWAGPEVDDVLAGWSQFAISYLLDEEYTPSRGSNVPAVARLYDTPWLARFFLERYRWTADHGDLEHAYRILERAFALGVGEFLAIGLPEVCLDVADALDAQGENTRATSLRAEVLTSAHHFMSLADDLPAHEVAYEQSIMAPLLALFTAATRLSDDSAFEEALQRGLPRLLAFGGPQPHARLHNVPIRHWDGYWFGIDRHWGDVFPHHWAVLTADVLARLPERWQSDATAQVATTVLRAGMSNFFADGSATCAFVMPSTVDGVPAHSVDPLANDQDWHLVIWARLLDDAVIEEQRKPASASESADALLLSCRLS